MTERMQQILKRYKVKVRANPETVCHRTYGFNTVVDSDSFADGRARGSQEQGATAMTSVTYNGHRWHIYSFRVNLTEEMARRMVAAHLAARPLLDETDLIVLEVDHEVLGDTPMIFDGMNRAVLLIDPFVLGAACEQYEAEPLTDEDILRERAEN
jgi:hypothetical protein